MGRQPNVRVSHCDAVQCIAREHLVLQPIASVTGARTVSFHDFKSQNFKLSVSNYKNKYVAYLSVLSQISNCQSLGRKNKHAILKTDRTALLRDCRETALFLYAALFVCTALLVCTALFAYCTFCVLHFLCTALLLRTALCVYRTFVIICVSRETARIGRDEAQDKAGEHRDSEPHTRRVHTLTTPQE